MGDPDTELMMRVREGDREAFRRLVERHQQGIVTYCYRSVGDRWEAEDLAQRVFLQVYKSAARYVPTAKFATWLFTIARNTVLNELRRRQRHEVESLEQLGETSEESAGQQFADGRTATPAADLQQRELEEKLQQAIQALPEKQRTALLLLRYQGMSYEEIARVLRCSVPATKSLLHRAKETLKSRLQEYLRA